MNHVKCNLDSGPSGAFAVARLEHIQLAFLDGELEVLNVLVMPLEAVSDVAQLPVNIWHHLFELFDRDRCSHARDDVFSLSVHQELAVKLLFARGRVPRETYPRPGSLAHVAEDHRLDVDGRAKVIGDLAHPAVGDGAVVIPGDRKSTRLNSSHLVISYAVFCLKKKKK